QQALVVGIDAQVLLSVIDDQDVAKTAQPARVDDAPGGDGMHRGSGRGAKHDSAPYPAIGTLGPEATQDLTPRHGGRQTFFQAGKSPSRDFPRTKLFIGRRGLTDCGFGLLAYLARLFGGFGTRATLSLGPASSFRFARGFFLGPATLLSPATLLGTLDLDSQTLDQRTQAFLACLERSRPPALLLQLRLDIGQHL